MAETDILFVDLDGTLVWTDVTVESLAEHLSVHPGSILQIIWWAVQGRALLKRRLAERTAIDPSLLPYNEEFLAALKEMKGKRRMVLATASDKIIAQSIADHLDLFEAVIGSDGVTNLKGAKKLIAMRAFAGNAPFSYAGNSSSDLPIFRGAQGSIVVNAPESVVRRVTNAEQVFPAPQGRFQALLGALRPHHWTKNVLVFIPLLTAHALRDVPMLIRAAEAFLCFSAIASAVYLINDIVDLRADRAHLWKRHRAIASGKVSIPLAAGTVVALLLGGGAVAAILPPAFQMTLATYFAGTLLYSLWFKRLLIVDTVILGSLYTARIIGGTAATGVNYSSWLLAFSLFLFFSLSLIKRYAELESVATAGGGALQGRQYVVSDRTMLLGMGLVSSNLSVLVLALYVNSDQVRSLYAQPEILWFICPLLLVFVNRLWAVTVRGAVRSDPVVYVLKDVGSICLIGLSLLVMFIAT